MASDDEKTFQIGEFYYEFEKDPFPPYRPRVTTWVYQGIVKKDCSSRSCDTPYHYHRFLESESWHAYVNAVPGQNVRTPTGIDVPSLEQAKLFKLTWNEFLKSLDEFRKSGGINR